MAVTFLRNVYLSYLNKRTKQTRLSRQAHEAKERVIDSATFSTEGLRQNHSTKCKGN